MNPNAVLDIALPLTLFAIMLSMGTTLRLSDFRVMAQQPRPLLVGIFAQMVLLPLLTVGVISLFDLPPELFVGFMILAFSPGGTTSNLFSYLAGGRLALSITLTAMVSIITPVTLPLLTALVLEWRLGVDSDISLPFLPTLAKLSLVTLLPLALGMALHRHYPNLCRLRRRLITRLPLSALFLVILAIIINERDAMVSLLQLTALPALLIASLALIGGYRFARSSGCSTVDAHTIAIETGIQNGGTAILITGTILHNPTMTSAAVMYGILMLLPTALYILWAQQRNQQPQQMICD
ncbi:MAG: bile acid:sodium symporter family protein [Gammaproteobacteria bacterium]|nr:bile acid:sodium symporter family protein [Gammaproteobacteria bacterium]